MRFCCNGTLATVCQRKIKMASTRKFFVGGNWKMNGNKKSVEEIITLLNQKGINPKTGLEDFKDR